MSNEQTMKVAIQSVIQSMMDRVMENVLVNDPFLAEKHHAQKPLYAALVPIPLGRAIGQSIKGLMG